MSSDELQKGGNALYCPALTGLETLKKCCIILYIFYDCIITLLYGLDVLLSQRGEALVFTPNTKHGSFGTDGD